MDNSYPEKFDSTKINQEEKRILDDFYNRRAIFNKYLSENNIKNIVTCPGCSYPSIGELGCYEICTICDWEDDGQDDESADEIWGGPNKLLSLTENRLIIGKKLNQLCAILGRKLNLNGEEVLSTIKMMYLQNDIFITKNFTMETRSGDPVWNKYKENQDLSLKLLVESE